MKQILCVILGVFLWSTVSLSAPETRKVLSNQGVIWGFDFIDSQTMIFTRRSGGMFLASLSDGKVTPIKGVPKAYVAGQGGMLDVRLHPKFKQNKWVYFTYSVEGEGGRSTRLSRAKLQNGKLEGIDDLFTAKPFYSATRHYGSRILFDGKGYIFFSVGDRGNRDRAQNLDTHNGKIIRLKEDGSVPGDNPFKKVKGALPEIWSYGHRNPQGLVRDPSTGQIYAHEHGPRGGDEINLIQKGKNYGWPTVSYGREYISRMQVGEGNKKDGMEPPIKQYTPSIAPCGMLFYSGKVHKDWKGNLFLGALAYEHLNRVVLKDGKAVKEERLYEDKDERVRNVGESPDGHIYFSTDDGNLYRL